MDKSVVLSGRKVVDTYREAHNKIYNDESINISEAHTTLLNKSISDLELLGYTSDSVDFGGRVAQILGKFWDDSNSLNVKELGFVSVVNFEENATPEDRVNLTEKWL